MAMSGASRHSKGYRYDFIPSGCIINGKSFKRYNYDQARKHYGYVYVTINVENGMKYVGISYKKTTYRGYLGSGTYLKRAINKYGRNKFIKYIIDVAETKYHLEHMERDYIRYMFGENCATSNHWYNLTDGLQRNGNHWAGLSSQERKRRIDFLQSFNKGRKRSYSERSKMSLIAKQNFLKYPDLKNKISIGTKRAMKDPEIKDKLHKHRNNFKTVVFYPDGSWRLVNELGELGSKRRHNYKEGHKISKKDRAHAQSVSQLNRFKNNHNWNYGRHYTRVQKLGVCRYNLRCYHIVSKFLGLDEFIVCTSIKQLSNYMRNLFNLRYNYKTVNKIIKGKSGYFKFPKKDGKSEYLKGGIFINLIKEVPVGVSITYLCYFLKK